MKGKVLIVDDEPIIGNLIEGSLTETGFEAEYFNSAAKALENIHRIKPDILVSDIVMPHMDGYELHRRLRQDPETANIPFVFLSTKSEMSDQFRESLRAGTDDYVCKPFKIENLIDRMESVMQRTAKSKTFQADFSWDIRRTGLGEIVQIAEINRKSGELIFKNVKNEIGGRIFFQKGEIVNAQTDILEGEEALFALMEKENGVFEFHERPVNVSQQITDTNKTVITEGRRMIEETRALYRRLPDLDILLDIKSRRVSPDIEKIAGRETLRNILSMVTKGRTARDIINCGVISRIRAGSVMWLLLDTGLVTILYPDHQEHSEPPRSKSELSESEPESESDRNQIRTSAPDLSPNNSSMSPIPDSASDMNTDDLRGFRGKYYETEAALSSPATVISLMKGDFLKVLKSFERSAFTGELEIRNISEKAAVYFEEGLIIHAYHGNVIAKKALYRIFSEKGGSIQLHSGAADIPRTIEGSLKSLLEEGAGEIENLHRLKKSTFDNTVSINIRILEETSKVNGRPGLSHILSLAQRNSRIGDIIDLSRMTDFQTYRHLFYLVKMGIFNVETSDMPASNQSVHIITDSTADLPADMIAGKNISVVRVSDIPDQVHAGSPLSGILSGKSQMFRIPDSSRSGTSSPVNDFHKLFQDIMAEKDILAIFSSKKISRTYEYASGARERFHPDYLKTQQQGYSGGSSHIIEIMDSGLISLGLGLVVAEAADKAMSGWSVHDISDHTDKLISDVRVFFIKNARSGSVGRVKTMLGNFMDMKTILGIWNGEVIPIDQVRGSKSAKEKLVQWISRSLENTNVPIRVGIMHTDMPEWAGQMEYLLKSRLNCDDVMMSHVGPADGSYCGPGMLAVAYFPVAASSQKI